MLKRFITKEPDYTSIFLTESENPKVSAGGMDVLIEQIKKGGIQLKQTSSGNNFLRKYQHSKKPKESETEASQSGDAVQEMKNLLATMKRSRSGRVRPSAMYKQDSDEKVNENDNKETPAPVPEESMNESQLSSKDINNEPLLENKSPKAKLNKTAKKSTNRWNRSVSTESESDISSLCSESQSSKNEFIKTEVVNKNSDCEKDEIQNRKTLESNKWNSSVSENTDNVNDTTICTKFQNKSPSKVSAKAEFSENHKNRNETVSTKGEKTETKSSRWNQSPSTESELSNESGHSSEPQTPVESASSSPEVVDVPKTSKQRIDIKINKRQNRWNRSVSTESDTDSGIAVNSNSHNVKNIPIKEEKENKEKCKVTNKETGEKQLKESPVLRKKTSTLFYLKKPSAK